MNLNNAYISVILLSTLLSVTFEISLISFCAAILKVSISVYKTEKKKILPFHSCTLSCVLSFTQTRHLFWNYQFLARVSYTEDRINKTGSSQLTVSFDLFVDNSWSHSKWKKKIKMSKISFVILAVCFAQVLFPFDLFSWSFYFFFENCDFKWNLWIFF